MRAPKKRTGRSRVHLALCIPQLMTQTTAGNRAEFSKNGNRAERAQEQAHGSLFAVKRTFVCI